MRFSKSDSQNASNLVFMPFLMISNLFYWVGLPLFTTFPRVIQKILLFLYQGGIRYGWVCFYYNMDIILGDI